MDNQEAISVLESINARTDYFLINDYARAKAIDMAVSALQAQQWIPCNPSELPKDKGLWVTHDNGEYRYIDTVYWDMTEWTDNVSDVVAYMPYIVPKPYQEKE